MFTCCLAHFDAAGLWQCALVRPSETFTVQDAVSSERCHASCVFSTKVQPRDATLRELRWLQASEHITFRLAVLVYHCLHGLAPSYLAAEVHRVTDANPQTRLQSVSMPALIIRPTLHSSIGDRSFPVAAAHTWNSLPPSVTASQSLRTFRKRLKTELLQRSYTTSSFP